MSERNAVDTITGYFYQFDLSILSVLRLTNPDDSIELECIEDVDIRTADDHTAIQCKYYAKTEYNHSVIKPAIIHMLRHFHRSRASGFPIPSYAIRGHFNRGQDKLTSAIDLQMLKKDFLTYTSDKVLHEVHVDLALSDGDLQDFLKSLEVDINAPKFEEQFQQLVRLLQEHFNCSPFAAEYFYYNNALRVIKELSTCQNSSDRTISKRDFLTRVNTSSILFNEWFIQKRGKKQHLQAIRAEYFTALNVSPDERFFLIHVDMSTSRAELKQLIYLISRKWSKTSVRETNPFCPYVYLHEISDDDLLELKKELYAEDFKFIDGYCFRGASFSAIAIRETASHANGVRIKLLNSLDELRETLNFIAKRRIVYQFHRGSPYFDYPNESVHHHRFQIENTMDIKDVV